MNEISTSISSAVEEQSTATREVPANIQGVNRVAEETRVDQFLASVRAM